MEARLEALFEEQLLEFVEDLEEPFDVKFLAMMCNQPVSEARIHNTLCKLEDEGKIVRVGPGLYLSTRALMRRWLISKEECENGVMLPRTIVARIVDFISKRAELGYESVEEFVKEAIRWRLHMYGVF